MSPTTLGALYVAGVAAIALSLAAVWPPLGGLAVGVACLTLVYAAATRRSTP